MKGNSNPLSPIWTSAKHLFEQDEVGVISQTRLPITHAINNLVVPDTIQKKRKKSKEKIEKWEKIVRQRNEL
jgi:hypothetical protein